MTAAFTARAWSCTMRLVVDDDSALGSASKVFETLLADVDRAASRFRSDSALSQANAWAGRPVPIPRLLVDLVAAALDAAAATDGIVDPTLGLAMQRIGYDRDIAGVVPAGPALPTTPRPGRWRQVRLHREAGLLTVPAGCALDLGATAKAYVADLVARELAARFDTAVMVELGGDIAVAGSRSAGWCVRVAEREGGDGQLVVLRNGGLTTSTTTIRRWVRGARPMHHIVDPRTGAPADGPWRTVTVAAPSAFEANVASTAAIVLGEEAVDWLENRRLAARLVARDGSVTSTAGWPQATELAVAS
jgi:thiamine biosynthesis lipoprotein